MPYEKLIHLKKFSALRKKQLLRDHVILHMWYNSIKKGKILHDKKTGKKISLNEVAQRHAKIVKIMFTLGYCHHIVSPLDLTLPKDLLQKSKKCGHS